MPGAASPESEHDRDRAQSSSDVFCPVVPLPRVPEHAAKTARLVASALEVVLERAMNSQSQKPMRLRDTTVRRLFDEALALCDHRVQTLARDDAGVYALAVFFNVQSRMNPSGVLQGLPMGFIRDGGVSCITRRLLSVYFLTEIVGARTFRDLENMPGWAKRLRDAGLEQLRVDLPARDFIELAFPFCMERQGGMAPLVRDWKLPGSYKWVLGNPRDEASLQERIRGVVREVLREQGVLNADGSVNKEVLCSTNWGTVLHQNVPGLINRHTYLSSAVEALEIAMPGVIGTQTGQIPPWHVVRTSEYSPTMVDCVTRYLVLRKLKLVDARGEACPQKIKGMADWRIQYERECASGLSCLPIPTAYEALKRCFPELFGWDESLIKPGDIRYSGMWHGVEGKRLFAQRFAWAIVQEYNRAFPADELAPQFIPHEKGSAIAIRPEQIRRLRVHLSRHGKRWSGLIQEKKLAAGLRAAACGDLEEAFALLLGEPTGSSEAATFGDSGITRVDLGLTAGPAPLDYDLLVPSSERRAGSPIVFSSDFSAKPDTDGLGALLAPRAPSKARKSIPLLQTAFEHLFHKRERLVSVQEDFETLSKSALGLLLLASREQDGNSPHLFSAAMVEQLLLVVRREILPWAELPDDERETCAVVIDRLRELPPGHITEILRGALLTSPAYDGAARPLDTIRDIVDSLFHTMAAHELRYFRDHEHPSFWYEPIAPRVHQVPISGVDAFHRFTSSPGNWIENTYLVLSGAEQEDVVLAAALAKIASKERLAHALLLPIEHGDIAVRLKLLWQFRERAHMRRPDRYALTTLRARSIPTSEIQRIITPAGELRIEQIDPELRDRLPYEWPSESCLPLMYWNGFMHIGAPANVSSLAAVRRSVNSMVGPDCIVQCHPVGDEAWRELTAFYNEKTTRVTFPEALPRWRSPFVSEAEYDAVVQELAVLRQYVWEDVIPHLPV